MDAHQMTFEDATFDCVVAQFVITLVANPEQVLSECHRVVKPGGRIILVNHLYSKSALPLPSSAGRRRRPVRWSASGISIRAAAGMGAIKCRDDPR
jgi:SAM-dependent methyltransferase